MKKDYLSLCRELASKGTLSAICGDNDWDITDIYNLFYESGNESFYRFYALARTIYAETLLAEIQRISSESVTLSGDCESVTEAKFSLDVLKFRVNTLKWLVQNTSKYSFIDSSQGIADSQSVAFDVLNEIVEAD